MTSWPSVSMRWMLAAGLLLGCVVEKQVLEPVDEDAMAQGGGTGATMGAGAGAGMEAPPIWVDCLSALRGNDGDACDPSGGNFPCEGREPCVARYAACVPSSTPDAHELVLGAEDLCSDMCSLDEECSEGSWCVEGRCQPCQKMDACPESWRETFRNGCSWCVPPSVCMGDDECGGGTCLAGNVCPPGCLGDPQCCHGNICSLPGCPGTEALDCSVVGCPGAANCIISAPVSCECDPSQGTWSCLPEGSVNFCNAP